MQTTGQRRQLSRQARAGLDVARGAAAAYVVAHHLVGILDNAPFWLDVPFRFGQEAVIVFFLLSGFVIFFNERDRVAADLRGYYLRRARRIYPPLLFAMAVGTVLWALDFISPQPTFGQAIGTLLGLQDIGSLKPGVITNPYLANDPLWSLSYELLFYLVFPVIMVLWRRSSRLARNIVGAASVVAFVTYLITPNHFSLVLAYLIIWWAGAMAASAYQQGRVTFTRLTPELWWLAAQVVVAISALIIYPNGGFGTFPILMIRHFAIAVAGMVVLCSPVRTVLARASLLVARPAAAVAGVSYGLYVVHYPILIQTNLVNTWWVVPLLMLTIACAWISDVGLRRLIPSPRSRRPGTSQDAS